MSKMNKLMKSQKGSISMFVIVSVLFLTFVLIGIYASYANKLKAQEEQLGKIQGNYGEHASEDGMDNLYIAQTQPEGDNEDEETGDADTIILLSEYQQVEYIQSTGTQYIDTGVLANNKTDVKARINLSEIDSTTQIIYGSRTSYQVNDYSFWATFRGTGMVLGYGANVETKEAYPYQGEDVLLYTDKNTFTLETEDGTYTKTITENSINGDKSVFIFAGNIGDSSNYCMKNMKLYYFKFYENDALIRDFIPCYRKSDNTIGLYDLVNDVFYTNQGTGTFVKGEDVI